MSRPTHLSRCAGEVKARSDAGEGDRVAPLQTDRVAKLQAARPAPPRSRAIDVSYYVGEVH